MSILSPDLVERVNQLSHEQKRQMKALSHLRNLPDDIQQLKHDLGTINKQFKRFVHTKISTKQWSARTYQFSRDVTEAERLEAELKHIEVFETDGIEMQFLEEVLQLRGELSQAEPPATAVKPDQPTKKVETGYIIFYRTEEGQQLEWSDSVGQWCAHDHGTCYPSRVAVEKIFTQLREHWPELTLKVSRRSADN